ncbi:hypothetical protein SAMN05444392_105130 [Seinonella peptonophila]|uniref:Uncharacterized protein n=1 Tax=Seinonella peptonophila TaxID=112248 RepID=A0A1M4XR01_9BACL|nr:hypothetical protein [Seinonella peptonophila]SHE95871.1 hypothetical protein SAMN05444392_105130 [Seinonella peptonophila]
MDILWDPKVLGGGAVVVIALIIVIWMVIEKKRKREVEELENMFPEGHLSGEQLEKIPVEKVRRSTIERERRNKELNKKYADRQRPKKGEKVFDEEDREFVQTTRMSTLKESTHETQQSEESGMGKRPRFQSSILEDSTLHEQAAAAASTSYPPRQDTRKRSNKRQTEQEPLERFKKGLKPSAGAQQEEKAAIEASKKFAGFPSQTSRPKPKNQTEEANDAARSNVNSSDGATARRKFKQSVLSSEEANGETQPQQSRPNYNSARRRPMQTSSYATQEQEENPFQSGQTAPFQRSSTTSRPKRSTTNQQQEQGSYSRRMTTRRKKTF